MAIVNKFRNLAVTLLILPLGLMIHGCGDTGHKPRIKRPGQGGNGGNGKAGKLTKKQKNKRDSIAKTLRSARGSQPSKEWLATGKSSTFYLKYIYVDHYPSPHRFLLKHTVENLKSGIDVDDDTFKSTITATPSEEYTHASELSFPQTIVWDKNSEAKEPETNNTILYSFLPSKENVTDVEIQKAGFPHLINDILTPENFNNENNIYVAKLKDDDGNSYKIQSEVRVTRSRGKRKIYIYTEMVTTLAATNKAKLTESSMDNESESAENSSQDTDEKKLIDKKPLSASQANRIVSTFVLHYYEDPKNISPEDANEAADPATDD